MQHYIGYVFALSWGVSAGIVTSIPLGPTGALVLNRASRNDKRGIYSALLGLASAQLIFQGIYHLGLSRVLTESRQVFELIGFCGFVFMVIFGCMHLWRAHKIARTPATHFSIDKFIDHQDARRSLFLKAFLAAVLNPFLLLYIIANVSMFVTTFPNFNAQPYIMVLLLGGVFGTALWYIFFGEMIRKNSFTWGKRGYFFAEIVSGVIMFAAGLFLLWKI